MEPKLVLMDMTEPDFWSEYEKFMREPIDDRATIEQVAQYFSSFMPDKDDEDADAA
jgi:hypothetical protein